MKQILLEDWIKNNGIRSIDARNWCRRNKLKTAKLKIVKVKRWVIDAEEKPPQL
jgi:hypothetical protein